MRPVKAIILILACVLFRCEDERTVTEPEPPTPRQKTMVTFQGKAFLDGQPDPVNALHLPLNWDIEIISYLPGDTTSYDTVYTDSSGVYTSTKLRQDGIYNLVARYPYYFLDTVHVEVKEGQVVSSIPEVHCQRLIRYSVHTDSLVYHSLESLMVLDEYVINLSSDYHVVGSFDLKEVLFKKDSLSFSFAIVDPNTAFCGTLMSPGETFHNRRARGFSQSMISGSYFLYAMPRRWPECAFIFVSHEGNADDVITNFHYQDKRHWTYKLVEPTRVDIELE